MSTSITSSIFVSISNLKSTSRKPASPWSSRLLDSDIEIVSVTAKEVKIYFARIMLTRSTFSFKVHLCFSNFFCLQLLTINLLSVCIITYEYAVLFFWISMLYNFYVFRGNVGHFESIDSFVTYEMDKHDWICPLILPVWLRKSFSRLSS